MRQWGGIVIHMNGLYCGFYESQTQAKTKKKPCAKRLVIE